MKPRRYPYTGRLKKPARLIIKEWQQYYDNYKGHKKEPINLLIDQTELCERLNAVESKSDGLTFNKI